MKRIDWIPSSDARLCDVHFASHMRIMRKNGSHRLKPDAVPTIFGENLPMSLTRQNMETIIEAAGTEPVNTLNKMEEISSEEDITEEERNDVFSIPSNGKGTSDPCVLQRLKPGPAK